ncbi:acyl-CoA desaturase [Botrimarina mediterranea]|uniref:Fatty acid desaturase n=1 Tax=Botrimarina mediterranea TaxID=2528022 RepID=A0A518K822_9BACT|nr:fatty acid desaturase [Botrimarina mediterranea]QDV73944.1 Fatty acid desaturase [Botrimarina mediterranea]
MRRAEEIEWFRVAPFLLLHLACLSVFWVGWSWAAVGVALLAHFARVFALTAFYHRYFSHRAFKTSRPVQFLGALLGNAAGQRGPIWWAAHHRHHHRASDKPDDIHSPHQDGFLWSHMLWFMTRRNYQTDHRMVKDLLRFPELRWIDRNDFVAPALLAAAMYGLGWLLGVYAPQLGTNGPQMLVWGFVISTVALYHVTFSINSLAHQIGTRRYETNDDSRNNFWLALVTFGEGWHNNHHHFPNSARQGFRWWEIDISFYLLYLLSCLGLVWDLKPAPVENGSHRRLAPQEGNA